MTQKSVMTVPPPRFGKGPVQGEQLEKAFNIVYLDVLSKMDVRYLNNEFSDGIVGDNAGGVVLGNSAKPTGRTVGVPTLVGKIANNGQAADQRFLPQVSAGNKLSVQSGLPLSSNSGDTASTIDIAPHTVQYGFGKTAYSSGSIAGLNVSTLYYIYANDPTYAGGAVTYQATTDPQTVVAGNGYYYVGSVTTGKSSSNYNVAAATSANPIQISTTVDNDYATGDSVTFADMPGDFAVLNGTSQNITVVDALRFTVAVDGSTFTSYTTGGTVTRANTTSAGGGGAGAGYGSLGQGGGVLP